MARYRSRRSSRRSASQSAANLLALALPAPIQRVADTRLGPLLMLVGVPSMLVAGLLQVNWNNGLPTVAVDPQAAATAYQRTREELNNLEQQGGFGQLASDIIGGIANNSHQNNYGQSYPSSQQLPQTRVPSANFPSTQPLSQLNHYTSTRGSDPSSIPWGQSSYPQQQTQQPTYSPQHYPQQPTYSQPTYSQPSTNAQQPTYQPSTYAHQPTYSQSGYQSQAASPSDNRNLTQQQLYQQQQYQQQQQQLYEQQLRDQQYRQWLAQQQHSSTQLPAAQQRSSTGYQQQYDSYGRAVSTGYPQPANSYTQPPAQPTTPYGQQNYNQGYLPNVNPNGRY